MSDLTRFGIAQRDTYDTALAELMQGRKQTHWMWFIFPQLKVLGRSETARHFGIADLAEARAYLADADLGPGLIAVARAVLSHPDRSATQIMGPVDALKLRSSATLFREAAQDAQTRAVFDAILTTFHDGQPCEVTLAHLRGPAAPERN
jgi:uncharacterized protein (DUF1810 family)